MQREEKHILLCADDFGMNPAINDGIITLAELGRLNATSCLVQGPCFASDLPALRESGLQIGLHLNFTESMGQPGLYQPVSHLILQSLLRRLDTVQLRNQIVRQLDLYENALGRAPDFIDGHQHIHQFAQIRTVLLQELKQRYPLSLPYLRNTWPANLAGIPIAQRIKAYVIGLLGAARLQSLAKRQGHPMNRAFLGVYDFTGGQQAYAQLLQAWLGAAQEGDMIMCHPAARMVVDDALGAQRYAEFQVLGSAETGQCLTQHHIRL